MASSGAMADFARMPTQRKILVFVVIGLLLGGLYYQFFFKSLNNDVDAAEAAHDAKIKEAAKLTSDIDAYEKLKPRYTELLRIVAENQKALPTQAEIPAFFETINRKVKDAGVEIKNWSQSNEEPVDAFIKIPVKIEITGTFMQIKKFFASLVQKKEEPNTAANTDQPKERVVSVEALALGDAKVVNHELILTAKFTATTFRQEAPKPLPSAKGAKPTGAPPPPPPPANTAPPMPSATTPAGAKARVEGSMTKDQERTDKGVEKAVGSDRLKGGQ